MDKPNVAVNNFTAFVAQLRTTECSQKEKISCFQHIAESIMSPALTMHINYANHCSTATNVLLLFCEDLDAVVRMSAEENLNKIFRALEKTRVSRILMDLYGEIKRNGNQRSLRICLNLFSYYAPRIKEKHVRWYALRLLACMQTMAQRRETQLNETLCEFVKSFGRYLQLGLTDSETCKLFEAFMANIGVECAVKRRCSAQNCISLIENARNKSLMAKHGLNKVIDLLLADQQSHAVLGALGFLRLLLPLIIRGFADDCSDDEDEVVAVGGGGGDASKRKKSTYHNATVGGAAAAAAAVAANAMSTSATSTKLVTTNECRQIIEIYDYCLHLLSSSSSSNHPVINAALEVLNATLQALDSNRSHYNGNENDRLGGGWGKGATAKSLFQLVCNQQLLHTEYLRRRKSLKNQIFQLKNYEMTSTAATEDRACTNDADDAAAAAAGTTVSTSSASASTSALARTRRARQGAQAEMEVDVKTEKSAMQRKQQQQQQQQEKQQKKQVAYKLEMQRMPNVKAQQQQKTMTAKKPPNAVEEAGAESSSTWYAVGIEGATATQADESTTATVSAAPRRQQQRQLQGRQHDAAVPSADDVDVAADNDDEVERRQQEKRQRQGQRVREREREQRIRFSARSISECVADDVDVVVDVDDNDYDDDDDDADAVADEFEDDFTSLCGINEPQAVTTCALTTTIDVANLIDAIEATSSKNGNSSHDSISGSGSISSSENARDREREKNDGDGLVEQVLGDKPQHLLTADDKSQLLSDIDNESFNSIDFDAEITIGGVSSGTAVTGTPAKTLTTAKAGTTTDVAGGGDGGGSGSAAAAAALAGGNKSSSSDTIGSFFNNLISHSNAASESVSKLFRQSSASKSTPTKAAAADKTSDIVSMASNSAADTLSFSSSASNSKRVDLDVSSSHLQQLSDGSSTAAGVNEDSFSTSMSMTPSTALMADSSNARNITTADYSSSSSDEEQRPKPTKRTNPFLSTPSPPKEPRPVSPLITLKIGEAIEQSLILYTARLIAVRFLLNGQMGGLQSDASIRVSIKSLSLCVVAQCVRLAPSILELPLEISEVELRQLKLVQEGSPSRMQQNAQSGSSSASGSPSQVRSDDSSSSNLAMEYERVNASGDVVDLVKRSRFPQEPSPSELPDELLLLEIKDDHFGKSTCDHLLEQPLSRSADPVLFARQLSSNVDGSRGIMKSESPQQKRAQQKKEVIAGLSKSEIIETPCSKAAQFKVTEASEDAPPIMVPPRPPKRTKSLRKKSFGRPASAVLGTSQQQLADLLLYYKHSDPMLRAGVQQIIGNFIQASGAGSVIPTCLNLQKMLAILLKGLQDEIHTVVIQALNTFDKVFSHVLYKYLTIPACHYQQQQQEQQQQDEQYKRIATTTTTTTSTTSNDTQHPKQTITGNFIGNDELIEALLHTATTIKTTSLQSPTCGRDDIVDDAARMSAEAGTVTVFITPSLLLNQLRLCRRHNKYWLVQNKYAEVISNLNYTALRCYYNNKNSKNSKGNGNGNGNKHHLRADSDADVNADADDVVCTYERIFVDELLQLIGDDDFRVREYAAVCLCQFVIQTARQHREAAEKPQQTATTTTTTTMTTTPLPEGWDVLATHQTNFNLLWDFCDYRVFSGMSTQLRNLFRVNATVAPPLSEASLLSSSSSSSSSWMFASASTSAAASAGIAATAFAADEAQATESSQYFIGHALRRRIALEEKVLAKILYRITNKLMELNDKNLQFGIVYALKLLLKHFNFVDYCNAWTEFNLLEICMKYSYYNYGTATDLNCQNDLIDVTGKLMAGSMLSSAQPMRYYPLLEQLLTHTLKMTNIYYHLLSNQKPLLFAKVQKMDLFTNAKELAIVQSVGYFGNDYVYIKLYNTLRSANDSYKITINQESGSILISLLKTCLNTLALCIELRTHAVATVATPTKGSQHSSSGISNAGGHGGVGDGVFPASAVLKLIEEILQYLTKLINYAPGECIACLRQLLKYLFAQNYGNRQQDYYNAFIRPYFVARRKGRKGRADGEQQVRSEDETMCTTQTINSSATTTRMGMSTGMAKAMASVATMMTMPAIANATVTTVRRLSATSATATSTTTTTATAATTIATITSGMATTYNSRNAIVATTSYDGSSSVGICSETLDYRLFGELFAGALNFPTWKSERDAECARHIKLFEPLVIYCLTLFLKSNAKVQAPILELLSQLLDLNVTYSVLDSKNVIFDQILNNMDLIESGVARNYRFIIPTMIKFLMQLTHKSDRKLITIPKIISIVNNLLANNAIRDCALLALKTLTYELFCMSSESSNPTLSTLAEQRANFQSPIARSPLSTPLQQRRLAAEEASAAAAAAEALLAHSRELDTQKEVVLGMLDKFISAAECQQVLSLLLLRERCARELDTLTGLSGSGDMPKVGDAANAAPGSLHALQLTQLTEPGTLYGIVCRALCEERVQATEWRDFYTMDTFFRNNGKNVLADSKEFMSLLQFFITKDVANFSDLSYATIILANVILRTEEIYLVNHIKLFLKNHPELAEQEARVQHQHQHQQQQKQHGSMRNAAHWLYEGPSTSAAAMVASTAARCTAAPASGNVVSEIKYFAKVLCGKLERCIASLHVVGCDDASYCALVARFVAALQAVCCRSKHKDALQSVFRLVLAESEFLDKYYNFLITTTTESPSTKAAIVAPGGELDAVEQLQLEVFKLLSSMKLLEPMLLLQQMQTFGVCLKWQVRRSLLRQVCECHTNPIDWSLEQVQQLFDVAHLNVLMLEHDQFVGNLCAADEEFCSLLQTALLRHARVLSQHAVRALLRLVLRLCSADGCSIKCTARFLQLLTRLHQVQTVAGNKPLQLQLERLARRLIADSVHDRNAIYDSFLHNTEDEEEYGSAGQLQFVLLSDLENMQTIKTEETTTTTTAVAAVVTEPRIIDEKWLFAQLIKFSTQSAYDPQQVTRILLEIQSEHKLHKMFKNGGEGGLDVARVLRHAIGISLGAMLATFRNNCIQYNPHIHYMQPNPLVRVSVAVLMAQLGAVDMSHTGVRGVCDGEDDCGDALYLCQAVNALMEAVADIEATALVYVEARFIEKFLRDQLLRPEHVDTLLRFLDWCSQRALQLLRGAHLKQAGLLLGCMNALLEQQLLWNKLNQSLTSQSLAVLGHVLDALYLALTLATQNSIFYRRYKAASDSCEAKAIFVAKFIEAQADLEAVAAANYPNYIVGAGKTSSNTGSSVGAGGMAVGGGGDAYAAVGDFETGRADSVFIPMHILNSIGISILRMNQFYVYAVTPFEIIQQQQQQQEQQTPQKSESQRSETDGGREDEATGTATTTTASVAASRGKLPTIPVESLSDVDVLRKFVKRLSIFGFTTRQQFEEYFMTFLLLINKVYDENMVDVEEQFQIKSTCFDAILELLITYKTFPIVGNKLSYFHHTTRWTRINCDTISLKKLHKVQLIVSPWNIFYQPNLERRLAVVCDGARGGAVSKPDNTIGTKHFLSNQYDLNFVWQQMEAYAVSPSAQLTLDGGDGLDAGKNDDTGNELTKRVSGSSSGSGSGSSHGEDVGTRNYRHFTVQSGVDFRSSSQLIFDVLTQILEHNYILVLPHLMKFCEICESRDQIKWMRDKALKMQETIPMDDTISHQHLIYLMCKTQAMLIPTLGELQQLCTLIGNYLKSSHVFIRNATLAGILSLLECCSKTNTTIGRLSEELSLLRELSIGYINRHGIVDESSMQCCDTHTKLVWTLNYSLIEWTSKFVPQCHLLSNTIIAASNFLKKTNNEDVYLCVLHGLERIVVISSNSHTNITGTNISNPTGNPGILNDSTDGGNGVVTPLLRNKIEKLALDLVKLENEKFSIPALKLLLSCMYVGSSKQLENTELSNGIVQDDPEIIAQQTDKVDILLHCIKSSTRDAAWIYGQVLCQIIRDLVPPNEILTKVIKEFLAINQPHCDVIAMIVYQVFRSAIDSSFLQMLQDWLICSLATFLALPVQKGVWGLSVIFVSASINLHLIKLFPVLLSVVSGVSRGVNNSSTGNSGGNNSEGNAVNETHKLGHHEIALFVTAAHDFYGRLSAEQRPRFRDAFQKFQQQPVYAKMLHSL